MAEQNREKFSYGTAIFISLVCIIFIGIHAIKPEWVDKITLILISIGIAPWLTRFFTKIKVGNIEARSAGRSQSSTNRLPPPVESQLIEPSRSTLTAESKKILATLWKYQKQTFKDDYTKRWMFRLFSNAVHYSTYLTAVAELLKTGLVALDPEKDYLMLTNEGISFIDKNEELQNYTDIYKF